MLNEGHAQTDAEVQELMSGNLCRCGAYQNIIAAIQTARTQFDAEPLGMGAMQISLLGFRD